VEDRLLRTGEVARVLGVSISTVERLIAKGAFAGAVVRFGRNTRITSAGLDAFIERHTVAAWDEPARPQRTALPTSGRGSTETREHADFDSTLQDRKKTGLDRPPASASEALAREQARRSQ
jgi:excisionase family DNA binding protein